MTASEIDPKMEKTTRKPTVDILRHDTYKKLSYKAESQNTSLRKFVNDILEMYLEKEEFLSQYVPKIKKIAFEDGVLYLRDSEVGKTATIRYLDGYIQCDVCDSKECIHVLYAMTLPELGSLEPIKSKGKKN